VVTVAYSMNRDITWLAGGALQHSRPSPCVPGTQVTWMTFPVPMPCHCGRTSQIRYYPEESCRGFPRRMATSRTIGSSMRVWTTTLSVRGKTFLDLAASELTAMEPVHSSS